ncbi:unnamed protein product [Linum trigynum]|uniref:Uncharacterized protein n=1 Tax=Linum trigynum TaxID=586398 RepID=A0AAV2GPW9_9ROSI
MSPANAHSLLPYVTYSAPPIVAAASPPRRTQNSTIPSPDEGGFAISSAMPPYPYSCTATRTRETTSMDLTKGVLFPVLKSNTTRH